jgi:UDP-3-O-[3-hydroxymyristoyl] N-acetylglucosamine deacetylase / 3-hydroxyacyl-[acyl-carrier-protein] dehydratase
MKQKTITRSASLSGVGLHTGLPATVTLKPAAVKSGLRFIRTDLGGKVVRVAPDTAVMEAGITRCTAIQEAGVRVYTIEHLLAAVAGLGIDNLDIEITGEEVPGMDGSSKEFLEALKASGIVEQDALKEYIEVKEPITVTNGQSSVTIEPAKDFSVTYSLEYENHPALRHQLFNSSVTVDSFERDIAPARTFCLESEVAAIRQHGLGKGANETNTLVMGNNGPVGNTLRFADECARHKALDIVGDLFLLGKPLRGHVKGHKSGHALNRQLVQKIMEQNRMQEKTYDVNEIMKILPHRYPFLFVDRVTISEPGKKGYGIKNVTINDGFFQGHFPTRPVMPGVLMLEAMAQTAGIVMLTSNAHPDKVALFMAMDGVKFRKIVEPGDQLVMEIDILRDREKTAQARGVGKVNGEVVVEAEMMFSYIDNNFIKNK